MIISNLETSITTHPNPWPDKAFNYRMHPANVDFLREAKITYTSLANNHTLDFCEEGLAETVSTLKEEGIAFAGAGHTRVEALGPAKLTLGGDYRVHVYSASDHPYSWSKIETFHHIDYHPDTRHRLRSLLTSTSTSVESDLTIFSVHWGPNYAEEPSSSIRELAHFLVDECDVDVVHGHSSHHIQGVEMYKGGLIIYGCGDFVDDYAIHLDWRNDLGALWRLRLSARAMAKPGEELRKKRLKVDRLEALPTRIKDFQTNVLEPDDPDWQWTRDWVSRLSGRLGTEVRSEDGMLVVDA